MQAHDNAPLPPSNDRRRAMREPANDLAEIAFAGSRRRITCLVHNLSAGGALLEVSDPGLPPRFILTNHIRGQKTICEIVWQAGKMVGVHFLTSSTRSATAAA